MSKTFPTLYKRTSTGELQEWTIDVVDNMITTNFGRVGGKIQTTSPDTVYGKNVGRANETTSNQQALAEAQSRWEKQQKRGYVKTKEAALNGEVSELVQGGVWPMLAKSYKKEGNKITWPAYTQPKLDGHRCLAVVDGNGKCKLWSRSRKPINSVPHIIKEIEALHVKNVIFDGELYNHSHCKNFDGLTHFIRQQKTVAEGSEVIQYHIYDLASGSDSFEKRSEWLRDLLEGPAGKSPLILVPTWEVVDEDELITAFEKFRKDGYEGCMVRNAGGTYEGHPSHRSDNLLKVKEFDDGEFLIVGVSEGRGKLAGHGIFTCKTKGGATFDAKMVGPIEELKKFYQHPEQYIGKMLTVQYQGITNKSGVPRFPVALRIREDI